MSLPSGWATAPILDLAGRGGVFCDGDWVESKDQDPKGDVRLIQLADVGDGEYRDRSHRFLTSSKAAELHCTHLRPGDVLIARMPDPIGRACVFPGDSKAAVTVVDVCIARSAHIDMRWLMWFVNAPAFRAQIAALQSGSTRKRISRSNLARLPLPIPPLQEQHRIAAAIDEHLSRVDAGVEALERVKKELVRYRASVLKAACEGRLVPTEAALARAEGRNFEPASELLARILTERRARAGRKRLAEAISPALSELPALPEGWYWVTLDQLSWQSGYGTSERCAYEGSGLPVLRIPNVLEAGIDLADLKRMTRPTDQIEEDDLVVPGDMLVVRTNGSRDLIGRASIPLTPLPVSTYFASYLIRFRLCASDVTWRFLSLTWQTGRVRNEIESKAATSAGQYNISQAKLASIPIPLPPTAEQHRIVCEVDRLLSIADGVTSAVDSALARAVRLRQSILKRAFEGRLVPQDPGDEPASALLARIRAVRDATEQQARPTRPRRVNGSANRARRPGATRSRGRSQ